MIATLTPPHIILGATSEFPAKKSAIWKKPAKVHMAPKTRAASPISFTHAGAFQAAKKRAISNRVMTAIPKEPANDRIKHSIFIILGVMALALFLLILTHMLFSYIKNEPAYYFPQDIAPIMANPVFLAIILTTLAYGEFRLEKWLGKTKKTHPVSFTSDYRKVSLNAEDILYIESRDSEVWIHTRDGKAYRNKTGISQWENLLGPDFIRIHRAFLVNGNEAAFISPETVLIAGVELPISRKYRSSVLL